MTTEVSHLKAVFTAETGEFESGVERVRQGLQTAKDAALATRQALSIAFSPDGAALSNLQALTDELFQPRELMLLPTLSPETDPMLLALLGGGSMGEDTGLSFGDPALYDGFIVALEQAAALTPLIAADMQTVQGAFTSIAALAAQPYKVKFDSNLADIEAQMAAFVNTDWHTNVTVHLKFVGGIPGFNFGGSYAAGGFTGGGRADEIAGLVHRGEYVVPSQGADLRVMPSPQGLVLRGAVNAPAGGTSIHINHLEVNGVQDVEGLYDALLQEARRRPL